VARPKDADPARTHDQILDAALQVLRESGNPVSLSLRTVARRAKLSTSAIQYYFSTKEDLLEACLNGYYERLASLIQRLFVEAKTAPQSRAFVEHVVRQLFRFARDERELLALRLATNASRQELHPSRQPEFLDAVLGQAAAALAPHTTVTPAEVRVAAQAMAVVVTRFALFTDAELMAILGARSPPDPELVEDHVVRLAVRLVAPRP
jgi:AcrR family transcriptional regulator